MIFIRLFVLLLDAAEGLAYHGALLMTCIAMLMFVCIYPILLVWA